MYRFKSLQLNTFEKNTHDISGITTKSKPNNKK